MHFPYASETPKEHHVLLTFAIYTVRLEMLPFPLLFKKSSLSDITPLLKKPKHRFIPQSYQLQEGHSSDTENIFIARSLAFRSNQQQRAHSKRSTLFAVISVLLHVLDRHTKTSPLQNSKRSSTDLE